MLATEDLDRLAAALAAEDDAWAGLLDATAAHHAALLAGAPASVEATLRAQLAALAGCAPASEARVALTQALATALELALPCSLERLLGSLPDAAAPLRTVHTRLRERGAELRRLNAANRRLDEHRLDLLQGDLLALREMLSAALGGDPATANGAGSLVSLRA